MDRDASPRLRIVLVVSNLEHGGAQRQVVELANHLDPARTDVTVVSFSAHVPLAATLRQREARLHVIARRGRLDVTVVGRLARLLEGTRADVVHGVLFDADVAARLAGRFAGTRLVVSSERNGSGVGLGVRHHLALRATRGCADLVVANSHAGAAFAVAGLGHDAARVRVVPNGVDVTRFVPGDAAAARAAAGLPLGVPVAGMFASFKGVKNHALFLAAAQRVSRVVPDAHFLIVGDALHRGLRGSGANKRDVERRIAALGLGARCHLTGNRDDVERLYPACDVTVLPSDVEGTPNVVLESMACAVPVVVTDVADNARVVPDGVVGHVVPRGDAATLAERVTHLLRDPATCRVMGEAARARAGAEFSCERLASRTLALYEEFLAKSMVDHTRGHGTRLQR
jgi:glycosyltransferase involved in cell wall biosynthesis